MRQLWQLFFGKTGRNTFITTAATIGSGLLTIWSFAILSHALGPEKLGLVSIALAVFSISFDILSLGTSQALVRFVSLHLGNNQPQQALEVTKTIFVLRLGQSVVLVGVAFLVGQLLAMGIYSNPLLVIPLTITIAAASGTLLIDFFTTLLQAYERFMAAGLLSITITALKVILLILLLNLGHLTVNWATLALVITPLIISVVGFIVVPKQFLKSQLQISVMRDLFHFSKWMTLWGLSASLAGRLDILFLGKFASVYQTGIYSVASRLNIGFILIGSAIATVLTPKLSRLANEKLELKHQIIRLILPLMGLIIAMIGVALVAIWFIPAIFGSQFQSAVPLFQWLTLGSIFFIASIPANVSLLALGRVRWLSLTSLAQLVLVAGLGWYLITHHGAQGAAWTLVIAYAAVFVASTGYVIKEIFAS